MLLKAIPPTIGNPNDASTYMCIDKLVPQTSPVPTVIGSEHTGVVGNRSSGVPLKLLEVKVLSTARLPQNSLFRMYVKLCDGIKGTVNGKNVRVNGQTFAAALADQEADVEVRKVAERLRKDKVLLKEGDILTLMELSGQER